MLPFRGACTATLLRRPSGSGGLQGVYLLKCSFLQAREKDEDGHQADLSKAIVIFVLGGPGERLEKTLLNHL